MLSSRRIHLALGAVCLSLLGSGAASALAGPTVTVRVEGESTTLLPLTTVTLGKLDPYATNCPYNSANAAINLAVESVGGTWDHGNEKGSKGDFTETILGETHDYEVDGTTWDVWMNDKWAFGICTDLLSEGDEVLLVADHLGPEYAPTRLPLVISGAPASVQAGTPITLDVDKITLPHGGENEGEGEPEPEDGVTVSGGGVSATTNAAGMATVTPSQTGQLTLLATKSGDAPSAPLVICVHNGNDGNCGTTAPAGTTTAPTSGTSSTGTGVAGFQSTKGAVALEAQLTGLLEDHVYGERQAPRVLAGSVTSGGPISSLSIELHRRYQGRCSEYDGLRERFVPARCGRGKFFKVSNNGVFSYLLPAALGPGRYVLDLEAADVGGAHTKLARGSTRIVFYVR